ncbi:hypothetical protein [Peterkaempfera sp. SMS 1(5)a]|uniref:hypothetical protein n=1 Tax=Peterkaempfera podocarpi TaxID=3232308 RepID=UPI00366BBAA3
MSVVLRPDASASHTIGRLTSEAMAVAGEGHWPTGAVATSHFTVRALERHRSLVPDGDIRTARYMAALRKASAGIGTVRLALKGLTLAPGGIMVCAHPQDDAIDRLAGSFADTLGDDGWYEAEFERTVWYSTLVHFTEQLHSPQAVVDWVSARRELDLGSVQSSQADLVVYRYNGTGMGVETLAAVPLDH